MHLHIQCCFILGLLVAGSWESAIKPDTCPFMPIYYASNGSPQGDFLCPIRFATVCPAQGGCAPLNSEERYVCQDDYNCPEGTVCCYTFICGSGKQCIAPEPPVTGTSAPMPTVTPPTVNCQTALGCAICTESNLCYQCEDPLEGPLHDGSGGCAPCAANCTQCFGGAGTCDNGYCDNGSYYDNDTASCLDCSPSCQYCTDSEAGYCTSCDPGYGLVYQGCSACLAQNCGSCNGNVDVCNYCNNPYFLTSDGDCQTCASNCSGCSNSGPGKCDSSWCNPGYVYVSSTETCAACGDYCMSCTQSGPGNCDTCLDGYVYTSDTQSCRACSRGCLKCEQSGPGLCDAGGCNISYGLNPNSNKCEKCSENCAECNGGGPAHCTACFNGYGRQGVANGQCTKCSDNCLTCENRICDVCSYGYGLTTSLTCDVCNTREGCLDCINDYICTQCNLYNQGPLLDGSGGCGNCAPNCGSCNNRGAGSCDNCNYGYGFNDTGACTACSDPNCEKCLNIQSSSQCKSCNYGYGVTANGVCAACNVTCSQCSSPLQCTYCYNYNEGPLHDNSGGCGPCAADCYYCNTNGAGYCDQNSCKQGYVYVPATQSCLACQVTNCSMCQVDGTCSQCDSSFVLNNNTGQCDECSPNCDSCSTHGAGECDSCSYGYGLTSTFTCEACAVNCSFCNTNGAGKCDPYGCNYGLGLLPDDTCGACAPGCQSCSNVSLCDYCTKSGFGPKQDGSGTCGPCAGYCTTCGNNGAGKCDSYGCNTGYVYSYDTETCSACPAYCKLCYPDGGSCTQCNPGFGLSKATGLCVACTDQNCNSCNYGTCQQCSPGYGLTTSGVCSPCAAQCTQCMVNGGGFCDPLYCNFNYGFDDNSMTCKPCPANCSACEPDENVCTQCDYDFGPLANGECSPCSAYCESCSAHGGGSCDYCDSGYALLPNNTCAACAPDCSYCSTPGQCNEYGCDYGYTFDQGTCITSTVAPGMTSISATGTTEILETGASETPITTPSAGSSCGVYRVSGTQGQSSADSQYTSQFSSYNASDCVTSCIKHPKCSSVDFNSETNACSLIQSSSASSTLVQSASASSTHYEIDGQSCGNGAPPVIYPPIINPPILPQGK